MTTDVSCEIKNEAYYDEHDGFMKNVAISYLEELLNPDMSISVCFKQELMPQVKRLRKAITDYDNCKGRILEVAKAIDSIMNICCDFSKMHAAIRDFLRNKSLGGI